jgi:hypothetical protein
MIDVILRYWPLMVGGNREIINYVDTLVRALTDDEQKKLYIELRKAGYTDTQIRYKS